MGIETPEPVRVAVTGAAGQIGYALLPEILGAGERFFGERPIELRLLEVEQAAKAVGGVALEVEDLAAQRLRSVDTYFDPVSAFDGAEFVFMAGARPRAEGMTRSDLLVANAGIFYDQGRALDAAHKDVKAVVVGNPANTNALAAYMGSGRISPESISAMTRLDHNRGINQLSYMLGVYPNEIDRFVVWGNHSDTMVPDITHVTVNGTPLDEYVEERIGVDLGKWYEEEFVPVVTGRGKEVMDARGKSSAMSAARAAINHACDWVGGTPEPGQWRSMGVVSDGRNYHIPAGLVSSVPVTIDSTGKVRIVRGLAMDIDTSEKLEESIVELNREKTRLEEMGIIQ